MTTWKCRLLIITCAVWLPALGIAILGLIIAVAGSLALTSAWLAERAGYSRGLGPLAVMVVLCMPGLVVTVIEGCAIGRGLCAKWWPEEHGE